MTHKYRPSHIILSQFAPNRLFIRIAYIVFIMTDRTRAAPINRYESVAPSATLMMLTLQLFDVDTPPPGV